MNALFWATIDENLDPLSHLQCNGNKRTSKKNLIEQPLLSLSVFPDKYADGNSDGRYHANNVPGIGAY